MAKSAVLGFPRMGDQRQLKRALESYWKQESDDQALLAAAKSLRQKHWQMMQAKGIDLIPSNDFSLYDHVLDTTCMVGAIPKRYQWDGQAVDLELYFAMARGKKSGEHNIAAMEMTKWFDTNYHYLVPELTANQSFKLSRLKVVEEFKEAKSLGLHTKPVLLGPVSYLLLGRMVDSDASPLNLLEKMIPVYEQLLAQLAKAGADWVQLDEPCLVWDYNENTANAIEKTYEILSGIHPNLKLQVSTYFGSIQAYTDVLLACPIDGLHLDLVRAPEQLEQVLHHIKDHQVLSLGLVNGRNIWRSDLNAGLALLEQAAHQLGKERLVISSSCSLLHVPFGLEKETKLHGDIAEWLAFATEKLDEINCLTRAINHGRDAVANQLEGNQAILNKRRLSSLVHRTAVQERVKQVDQSMFSRQSVFAERKKTQQENLKLPLLPTTTIGSFPQTQEIRLKRRDYKQGNLEQENYNQFLQDETKKCIAWQEEIGLDVLVHGEFERNDMVEYFGEKLEGFIFSQNGWVQSYGSRCVKPPIIFGDVARKAPMTVDWSSFAQSQTTKPMKGMLTGPVTILQWSFVRDDQPRKDTCQQIALAIRDEVVDLEQAGIKIIQIDEPALREGLPLKQSAWQAYLQWGVDAFRLSAAGVKDSTQIHTHMCYGDFEDILEAIAALDADVISIEASRSDMQLLKAFADFNYPNDIGPGVYDIHSPLVPSQEEMVTIIKKAMAVIPAEQLWINPDCGLKTRGWPETKAALANMVAAAKKCRE